jgi:hypothetical protein
LVGFSSGGVVAGSTAAVIQAGMKNVPAGSLFAACQSVAATGVLSWALPVVATVGAASGIGYYIYKKNSLMMKTKIYAKL